ncbi:hypothetical protein AV530_005570 [Patagioenas fasciata monilis]|uniref:Uncharacterized protein n=1 Tax=Patagioenas fasciata monilis TaxID=372326 RepID=A0A1V4JLU1_PATFA|nr:hypothetical protein AV530_005570 [Patagioenas fasciata monilis]
MLTLKSTTQATSHEVFMESILNTEPLSFLLVLLTQYICGVLTEVKGEDSAPDSVTYIRPYHTATVDQAGKVGAERKSSLQQIQGCLVTVACPSLCWFACLKAEEVASPLLERLCFVYCSTSCSAPCLPWAQELSISLGTFLAELPSASEKAKGQMLQQMTAGLGGQWDMKQMVTAIGGSEGDGGGWDGQGNQDDTHPLSIVYRKRFPPDVELKLLTQITGQHLHMTSTGVFYLY